MNEQPLSSKNLSLSLSLSTLSQFYRLIELIFSLAFSQVIIRSEHLDPPPPTNAHTLTDQSPPPHTCASEMLRRGFWGKNSYL